MTKRNPGNVRMLRDDYATPEKALLPVLPFLREERGPNFAEPCCGAGKLVLHMKQAGYRCVYDGDITRGMDASNYWPDDNEVDFILTNPPWSREILHRLIAHFVLTGRPTWLLLDSDWAHTKQATPLLSYCSHIVSIGRVRWMEGTTMDGFDNAAWYRFTSNHNRPVWPQFVPRSDSDELSSGGSPSAA